MNIQKYEKIEQYIPEMNSSFNIFNFFTLKLIFRANIHLNTSF